MTGIGVVEAVSGRRPEGATSNRAFNWLLLAKFFLGWVATLVIAAATSAAFTAQVRAWGGAGPGPAAGEHPEGRERYISGASACLRHRVRCFACAHRMQGLCALTGGLLTRLPTLPAAGRVRSLQDRHRPARGRQPVP